MNIETASEPLEAAEAVNESSELLQLNANSFATDCKQVLLESADTTKTRFALIQWIAESPDRTTFLLRKQEVTSTLNLSTRQVERLLKKYYKNDLEETTGTKRSDKGEHKILHYWVDFINWFYEDRIKKKLSVAVADVVREVKRHAEIDLQLQPGEYPDRATVYRVLKPVIAREALQNKIRNPGSGSWFHVKPVKGNTSKSSVAIKLSV
jgi:putative transposase